MKLSRRGFFKMAGAAAAAAIVAPAVEQIVQATAPLFIPAERLEMGVPHALKPDLLWHGAEADGPPASIYLPAQEWADASARKVFRRPAWLDDPVFRAGMERQGYDPVVYEQQYAEARSGERLVTWHDPRTDAAGSYWEMSTGERLNIFSGGPVPTDERGVRMRTIEFNDERRHIGTGFQRLPVRWEDGDPLTDLSGRPYPLWLTHGVPNPDRTLPT